jgi:hypothetical protein
MKNHRHLLFIVLAILLLGFQSCKTQKYTPLDYPKTQIRIGNGGGFSGATTQYAVLENGDIFMSEGISEEYIKIGVIDKESIGQHINNFNFLKLQDVVFDEPGNTFTFITYMSEGKTHKIQWGNRPPLNKNVKTLYDNILNSISNTIK